MKTSSFLRFLSFSVVFLVLSCKGKKEIVSAPSARLIPVDTLFKTPERAMYRISPDGNYVSFLAPYENRQNLFVQRIGEAEAHPITQEKDRDISNYFWANDKRLVFQRDEGGDENYFLVAVDRDGGNEKPLTRFPGVKTKLIDVLEDNDREVLIGLNKNNPQVFDAYRLNVETGKLTLVAKNPGNIIDWATDNKGQLRLAYADEGTGSVLLYRPDEKSSFRPVLHIDISSEFSIEAFGPENSPQAYAVSNLGRDKVEAVVFDLEQGKEIRTLYSNEQYDVDGLIFSRKHKLLGAYYESWKDEFHFFDDGHKKFVDSLRAAVGDEDFNLGVLRSDKQERVYVLSSYSDRDPGTYYLYDRAKGKLTLLAHSAPWIKKEEMASVAPIRYTARDGLPIEGYLTLPVGYTKETATQLPAVVMPHGGPWARDGWGFDSNVQFLANRGYAVLQMNFRGSTGYGRKFYEASFKQWGLAMQDDITDGVKWLIKEGIVDSTRVGIYGGSYGGYATLAGLAFTPDLYACGVDYVGVSNLFTFMKSIPPYWKPFLDKFYVQVGNPSILEDSVRLAKTSPALHADKIKAPLLIAQGANDPRVNKNESDQMVAAMRARGVEVSYIVKDNEGHGFRNEENQIELFEAMEAFLAKHLGGRALGAETPVASDSSKKV